MGLVVEAELGSAMGTIEREGGADDDRTLFARIAPLTLDAEKLMYASSWTSARLNGHAAYCLNPASFMDPPARLQTERSRSAGRNDW